MSLKENDIFYESKREAKQEPKGYAKQIDDYAKQLNDYAQLRYQSHQTPMPPELFKQLLKGLTPMDDKNKPKAN